MARSRMVAILLSAGHMPSFFREKQPTTLGRAQTINCLGGGARYVKKLTEEGLFSSLPATPSSLSGILDGLSELM